MGDAANPAFLNAGSLPLGGALFVLVLNCPEFRTGLSLPS
jgi:hypothetical protein